MIDNNYRKVEGQLYSYNKLKAEIERDELEIEQLKNEYGSIQAVSYEEKSAPTNAFSSIVENELENKEKAIARLEYSKKEKQIKIRKIENMLSILKVDERKLIELRYIKELQFKDIASILNMHEIYLIQKRKKIINEKLIPYIIKK